MLIIFAASVVLFACQKESTNDESASLEGAYIGTFFRTGMDTVSVSITFDRDYFQGTSSREKYPAICGGRYELTGNSIVFTDTCTWTADFDWSLILNNTYTVNRRDSVISFSRTNGSVRDEYILARLLR